MACRGVLMRGDTGRRGAIVDKNLGSLEPGKIRRLRHLQVRRLRKSARVGVRKAFPPSEVRFRKTPENAGVTFGVTRLSGTRICSLRPSVTRVVRFLPWQPNCKGPFRTHGLQIIAESTVAAPVCRPDCRSRSRCPCLGKQHHVCRFLLKNFSSRKKLQVYVYGKSRGNEFRTRRGKAIRRSCRADPSQARNLHSG